MRRLSCALAAMIALFGNTTGSATEPFVLGPPEDSRPVVVEARFDLEDVADIDDEAERFEFTGVMTLTWRDPRQAFDPAVEGVAEKVFQGDYQFNEISPGWYPQLVLVNESGLYETSGVVLRVRPDGSSVLIETLDAAAEGEFGMRRFPFDRHRLEAVFQILGFGTGEVALRADPGNTHVSIEHLGVPQWLIHSVDTSVRDRPGAHAGAGRGGPGSAFVVTIDAQRDSFYVVRLFILPLVIIVFLSFSVFWMERSSLGDRISVSFIGILTGVTYQLVIGDQLPHISYFTLMHGFLNLSFLTMCATVLVNLRVGALDKRGDYALGDRIDRRCRWAFPLVYTALNLVMLTAAFTFF